MKAKLSAADTPVTSPRIERVRLAALGLLFALLVIAPVLLVAVRFWTRDYGDMEPFKYFTVPLGVLVVGATQTGAYLVGASLGAVVAASFGRQRARGAREYQRLVGSLAGAALLSGATGAFLMSRMLVSG